MRYDIYYSTTRKNKRYLVWSYGKGSLEDLIWDAKRFFKTTEDNLKVDTGWIRGGNLYWDEPDGIARRAIAISYQKGGGFK